MSALQAVMGGSQAVTPYLIVRGAARALEFYSTAFGAVEGYRLTDPTGRIGHAELLIGGSKLMLADEYPDFGAVSPAALGGTPVRLHIQVENVDKFMSHAVRAGATEQVSPEEMQKRFTAALSAGG
jgi:PhnB protein